MIVLEKISRKLLCFSRFLRTMRKNNGRSRGGEKDRAEGEPREVSRRHCQMAREKLFREKILQRTLRSDDIK